ncbi:MAG TPA: hypothetical protein VG253_00810 [Streptosporangiaceae bacterium]|nr:hypothetical protein [Streptosporangiaceae bacterium]
MKKLGIATVAAVVVVFGAVGAAAALTTGGSGQPRAYNGEQGWTHAKVRPPVIFIGGSDVFVRTPHWSTWSASSASSHGTLWANTCQPNCAAGHYVTYPALLTLSGPTVHHGTRYFSAMQVRYFHTQQRDYRYHWGTYRAATIPGWIGGPGAGS